MQPAIARVLIATDLSPQADVAFQQALAVAKRAGAAVVILWAQPAPEPPPSGAALPGSALDEIKQMVAEHAANAVKRLDALVARAGEAGVSATTRVERGHADDTITAVAAEVGADLIVTGTRGNTGFKQLFLGSVAQSVLRQGSCDVMVARGQADATFRRVLVPIDFSPTTDKVLALATALAAPGAHITVFHAWQYPAGIYGVNLPNPKTGALAELREQLVTNNERRGADLLAKHGGEHTIEFAQEYGQPASLIQHQLDKTSYDLVVMGTHGYRGFKRLILGSVAEATVRHASCTVAVARAAAASALD